MGLPYLRESRSKALAKEELGWSLKHPPLKVLQSPEKHHLVGTVLPTLKSTWDGLHPNLRASDPRSLALPFASVPFCCLDSCRHSQIWPMENSTQHTLEGCWTLAAFSPVNVSIKNFSY